MEIPQNAKRPGDRQPKFVRPADRGEDFFFEHNGQQYSVPPASAVKIRVARQWEDLPESTQIFKLLEYICDDETLEAIEDMTGKEFQAFHAKWQAHQRALAQATQGES